MEGTLFDEDGFFASMGARGIRYLLVGRQACIAYGLPVLTADYDIAVAREDLPALVDLASGFGLVAPDDLERRAFFTLENDEKIDVFCAATYPVSTGGTITFEQLWARKRYLPIRAGGSVVHVPHIRDLIAFKLIRPRKKDLEDVRALEIVAAERGE